MKKCFLIFFLLFCLTCSRKVEQKVDFIEVRISRYAVLERATETLVLRKVGRDWSSMILGNGLFSVCQYQKIIEPKSNLENVWQKLVSEGLLEVSEGEYTTDCCTDGHGFEAEIFYQGELKRFSFQIPEKIPTKEAKQIQNIGNIISENFETPMFYADYS